MVENGRASSYAVPMAGTTTVSMSVAIAPPCISPWTWFSSGTPRHADPGVVPPQLVDLDPEQAGEAGLFGPRPEARPASQHRWGQEVEAPRRARRSWSAVLHPMRRACSSERPPGGLGRARRYGGSPVRRPVAPPSAVADPRRYPMAEAYIIDAVRTPVGRRGGGLGQRAPRRPRRPRAQRRWSSRTGIDPAAVDDVVFGCLDTIGPQAGDIARTAWLAAGLPEDVPGTTIDRQCGSSQQAVHFAAQGVMSRHRGPRRRRRRAEHEPASRSPPPCSSAEQFGFTDPFSGSTGWVERYGDQEITQFRGADMIAEQVGHLPARTWRSSRSRVHQRALAAIDEGRFDSEIVAVRRAHPATRARGRHLAGEDADAQAARPRAVASPRRSRSQISDGAAAHADRLRARRSSDHGLTPRARIHHLSVRGDDPVLMLTGADPGHPARARARPA